MCHTSGSKGSQPTQYSSIHIGIEIIANERLCQASEHADAS